MSIIVMGDENPSVPNAFQASLRAFDPDLYVTWHRPPSSRKPGRWKIERCTRHRPDGGPHNHICVRTYILMVQDEEGTPMPLGDWVFNKLREMRHNWEALGGDSERGVRNALAESDRIEKELEAKRRAASDDMIRHNAKDKRVQINRLYDLVARHDMRPNR